MRRRHLSALAATLLAILCAGPLAAVAGAGTNAVLNDCYTNGRFTHQWSHAQLEQALKVMSQSTKEYSSCPDLIQRALESGIHLSGSSGGGGGGGSFLPVPVIVILVALLLAGGTFGVMALRARQPRP
jgi:hypothetical protein